MTEKPPIALDTTALSAATKLDFPEPFLPITKISPSGIDLSSKSSNVRKPEIVIESSFILGLNRTSSV